MSNHIEIIYDLQEEINKLEEIINDKNMEIQKLKQLLLSAAPSYWVSASTEIKHREDAYNWEEEVYQFLKMENKP